MTLVTSRRIHLLFPRLFPAQVTADVGNYIEHGDGFRPRAVINGASNWARNNISSGDPKTGPCGWFHWLQALNYCPFDVVSYASVGGRTMSVINANFDTEVTPYDPDIVFMGGDGIGNAIQNDLTATTILADVRTWIDKVIALDAVPVIATCPPNATITSTARADEWHKVNDGVADLARADRRVILMRTDELFADANAANSWPTTTSGTGAGSAAWTSDGTHWQPRAAIKVAQEFQNSIKYRLGARTLKLPQTNSHPYKTILNPCNIGSSGTLSGGATGVAGNNCTLNGSCVGSKVARTDFQHGGEWCQVAVTGASASVTYRFDGSGIPANLVPGSSYVWAAVEIMLNSTPTNLRGFKVSLSFTPNSNTYIGFNTSESGDFTGVADAGPYIPTGVPLLIFTPVGLLPASATACTITLEATKSSLGNLSANFNVGRAALLSASAQPFNAQTLVVP